MNKHQTIAGPSCLTNAADDEPLFVLRANDELAPLMVRRWAQSYAASKGCYQTMTVLQREKFDEAMQLAEEMEQWKQRPERGSVSIGERMFPVNFTSTSHRHREVIRDCPKEIPWRLVEAHSAQVRANHHQTVERVAERGGLSPCELRAVLSDRGWYDLYPDDTTQDQFVQHTADSVAWLKDLLNATPTESAAPWGKPPPEGTFKPIITPAPPP